MEKDSLALLWGITRRRGTGSRSFIISWYKVDSTPKSSYVLSSSHGGGVDERREVGDGGGSCTPPLPTAGRREMMVQKNPQN